jgi:N-carbamoylputrescine amidase
MDALAVAAVQFSAFPAEPGRNLAVALQLVEDAAAKGASLIVLPELTPGGYLLTEAIWDTAESANGRSVTWLQENAQRLGVYLGMSYLEADGEHFYNTFVLTGPSGNVCGTVRKNPPASAEAYFFAAGTGPHFIDTPVGRIGVSICYEAMLYERLLENHANDIDLLVIPMSAGTPTPTFPIRRSDCARYNEALRGLAAHHARALGVPVVTANKCGPLVTAMPRGMPYQNTYFPGLSAIADSDGAVRGQLGLESGVVVAQVSLDPGRKVKNPPRRHGRWALEVPWFSFFFPVAEYLGSRAYARSKLRAVRARGVSGDA